MCHTFHMQAWYKVCMLHKIDNLIILMVGLIASFFNGNTCLRNFDEILSTIINSMCYNNIMSKLGVSMACIQFTSVHLRVSSALLTANVIEFGGWQKYYINYILTDMYWLNTFIVSIRLCGLRTIFVQRTLDR